MAMTKEKLEEIEQNKKDLFPIYLELFNSLMEEEKFIEAQSVARVACGLLPLDSKDKDYKRVFKHAFAKPKKEWVKAYEERHPVSTGNFKNTVDNSTNNKKKRGKGK